MGQAEIDIAVVAHRDVHHAAGAACHREKLELPLKEWMGRIGHLHEIIVSDRLRNLLLMLSKGINKG